MKKLLLAFLILPTLTTQASYWGFWAASFAPSWNTYESGSTLVETNYYQSFKPAKFEKLKREQATFALYFHANWCGTCRVMDDMLFRYQTTFPNEILKVDFDRNTSLKRRYRVVTPSTIVFFREGKPVAKIIDPTYDEIVTALSVS